MSLFKKVGWFLLLALAFFAIYWFGVNAVKSFNNIAFKETVLFPHAEEIESMLAPVAVNSSGLSIVYFWQAYCPCNLGVDTHYKTLYESYSKALARFYIVDLSTRSSSFGRPSGHVLNPEITKQLSRYIQYTPAIAVIDNNGRFLYYGPHSLGFVCNTETSFVESTIQVWRDTHDLRNINVIGEGCFCGRSK